jgi:hypothetical protein
LIGTRLREQPEGDTQEAIGDAKNAAKDIGNKKAAAFFSIRRLNLRRLCFLSCGTITPQPLWFWETMST